MLTRYPQYHHYPRACCESARTVAQRFAEFSTGEVRCPTCDCDFATSGSPSKHKPAKRACTHFDYPYKTPYHFPLPPGNSSHLGISGTSPGHGHYSAAYDYMIETLRTPMESLFRHHARFTLESLDSHLESRGRVNVPKV